MQTDKRKLVKNIGAPYASRGRAVLPAKTTCCPLFFRITCQRHICRQCRDDIMYKIKCGGLNVSPGNRAGTYAKCTCRYEYATGYFSLWSTSWNRWLATPLKRYYFHTAPLLCSYSYPDSSHWWPSLFINYTYKEEPLWGSVNRCPPAMPSLLCQQLLACQKSLYLSPRPGGGQYRTFATDRGTWFQSLIRLKYTP